MKGFKESETKKLFELVKEKKNLGKGVSEGFKEYAKISGRAQGSVRNYYYKKVNECKNDEKLRKKLGVSNEMFPIFIEEFNKSQSIELLKEILTGVAKGKSVRSVVSKLAFNNDKLALRYQNKYRNLLKSQKETVINIAKSISEEYGVNVNPYKSESEEYLKIESEIDKLLKRLYLKIEEEKKELESKLKLLELENRKLKEMFKKNMQDKNVTASFFNKKDEEISVV